MIDGRTLLLNGIAVSALAAAIAPQLPTCRPVAPTPVEGSLFQTIECDAAGGMASLAVATSTVDCPWAAQTWESWITFDKTSGIGSTDILLTVAPNTFPALRLTTLQVGGVPIVVRQLGPIPPPQPASQPDVSQ